MTIYRERSYTMLIPLTESMYYILLAVLKPNHGYGIIQKVQELTDDRVILGAGTLYGAINTMLDKRWLVLYSEEKESRKKKEYIITDLGKDVLKAEINRLDELFKNGVKEMECND